MSKRDEARKEFEGDDLVKETEELITLITNKYFIVCDKNVEKTKQDVKKIIKDILELFIAFSTSVYIMREDEFSKFLSVLNKQIHTPIDPDFLLTILGKLDGSRN